MLVLITGGAGFIGSNLVDHLRTSGHSVRVIDNFSTGRREFLKDAVTDPSVEVIEADLLDTDSVNRAVKGVDAVIHLAANADVRFGWNHPRRDVEQNVIATQNVLEAMRIHSVRRFLFSSTGSVYGEAEVVPTPEDAPYPVQTSLYGASKSAAEGVISAYAEAGIISATIFRFVSILGPRYTHGHVIDFVAQLKADPKNLRVLGDGLQRKSYLHVSDCIAAILLRLSHDPRLEILNLGAAEYCKVNDSVGWITSRMGLEPAINHTGGQRGWVGDNPFIFLDTSRIRSMGWTPGYTIQESVEDTVDWILANEWVLSAAITE
jgi:UDP-glucose 4-epimerase